MEYSNMKRNTKRLLFNMLLIALLLALFAAPVWAGTTTGGNDPFSSITQTVITWLKGGLGMLLAVLALTVGLVAGVARGSIVGALAGVAVAIAAYWGPDVLQSMFGATVVAHLGFATIAGF